MIIRALDAMGKRLWWCQRFGEGLWLCCVNVYLVWCVVRRLLACCASGGRIWGCAGQALAVRVFHGAFFVFLFSSFAFPVEGRMACIGMHVDVVGNDVCL